MIAVSNRIPVNPDYADEFEARFQNRAHLVDQMEGFVSFQILRPVKEGDPYVVMTMWESLEHFEAWKNSPSFRQQHGQQRRLAPEALLGEPKIEIGEIIQQRVKSSV